MKVWTREETDAANEAPTANEAHTANEAPAFRGFVVGCLLALPCWMAIAAVVRSLR
ncbi:MAG: hypothetical protein ACXVQJ_11900 [Actinomycetota bacterium]